MVGLGFSGLGFSGGVGIFWWLGFSGLGLSGWVDGGLGSRGWDFLVGLTVAWVLGVGIFWWRWVDGGLGFGLGVVVEPWVWELLSLSFHILC